MGAGDTEGHGVCGMGRNPHSRLPTGGFGFSYIRGWGCHWCPLRRCRPPQTVFCLALNPHVMGRLRGCLGHSPDGGQGQVVASQQCGCLGLSVSSLPWSSPESRARTGLRTEACSPGGWLKWGHP